MLLHGFTGDPGAWDGVVACLPAGRAVAREVLLGHGPGGGPDAPSWDAEVARLAGRIAPRGPVHLVGYSLGARVALGVAVARPDLVARLTLVGARPGLTDAAARAERVAEDEGWARLLEAEGIAAFVARWEALPLFASQARLPTAARAAVRARRLARDPGGLARALRVLGLGRMPDLRPRLAEVSCPVDVVRGADDVRFAAPSAALRAGLPRATGHVAPGVGHDVPLEAPAALAALLAPT